MRKLLIYVFCFYTKEILPPDPLFKIFKEPFNFQNMGYTF